jgi:hypothetical protein
LRVFEKHVIGDPWYVQTWTNAPITRIQKGGTWETRTHRGYEYAALLIMPTFNPPATTMSLPRVGGEVVAITKMKPGNQG